MHSLDPIRDHELTEMFLMRQQRQMMTCEGGCEDGYPRLVTFTSMDGAREMRCCEGCFRELRNDETESICRGL